MVDKDQRYHSRINSLNLLSYVCIDKTDQIVAQGIGRTLNVSEGGILLETHIQIDSKYNMSLAIGFEEELADIKGKIVHSKPHEGGMYESGIHFFEINEKASRVLKEYIKEFKKQQSASHRPEE